MKRRNLIIAACFLVYIAIVILPSIIHHYVYPNNNDDTILFLNIILANGLHNPFAAHFVYAGYIYLCYPLLWFSHIAHLNFYTVWVWFNILIMVPIGCVLYFIGAKLIDWKAGLMMLLFPIFVSGGIVSYETTGVLFSLILTTILMPLLIYCVVQYLLKRRVYLLILVIILAIVTSTFHTTGLYVPIVAGVALVGFIIYKLAKKEFTKSYIKLCLFVLIVLVIGLGAIFILNPQSVDFVGKLFGVITGSQTIWQRQYSLPAWYWLTAFVSLPIIAVIGVSLFIIVKNKVQLSNQIKLYLYLLVCWVVVLLILGYGRLSPDPIRAELDTSIAIGLLGTLLFGIALPKIKDKTILLALSILIFGGLAMQLHYWFQNNSAIKESDKEAIAYINTLQFSSYNCSSNVPYWIYDQLSNIKYSNETSDLIITRNKPASPRSDRTFPEYVPHDYTLNSQDVLVKSFVNDGVEVDIYEQK